MENVSDKNLKNYKITFDLISYILVFFLEFVAFGYFSLGIIKYLIIFIVFILILLNIKYIINIKTGSSFIILSLILSFIGIFTSFQNNNNILYTRNSFLASIVHFAIMLEIILVFLIAYKKNDLKLLLKTFLILYLFFIVIVDIEIIYKGINGLLKDLDIYFIGNKFNVSYFHLQYIILLWAYKKYIGKQIRKENMAILIIYVIIICKLIHSSTSMIGGIILLIGLIFEKDIRKFIGNPVFFVGLFLLSGSFIFWYESLSGIPLLKMIFEEMGENIDSMSGRKSVYDVLVEICSQKIWLGYGYGITGQVLYHITFTQNTQNGLWELIFSFGIIGAFVYSCIIFIPFKLSKKATITYPLYLYIILMVIVAFIEIPYGTSLLIFALLAYLINMETSKNNELVKL